jgi:hypothetical protein
MIHPPNRGRPQFSLRTLLASVTWLALVIAICVGQQQAASRQRAVIEKLKAGGTLPVTIINGRGVPPAHQPPPVPKKP